MSCHSGQMLKYWSYDRHDDTSCSEYAFDRLAEILFVLEVISDEVYDELKYQVSVQLTADFSGYERDII